MAERHMQPKDDLKRSQKRVSGAISALRKKLLYVNKTSLGMRPRFGESTVSGEKRTAAPTADKTPAVASGVAADPAAEIAAALAAKPKSAAGGEAGGEVREARKMKL